MTRISDEALSNQRFALFLVGLFAVLALGLAGVRRSDLLRLVLRQGVRLSVIGVFVGLLSEAPLAQLLGGLLYGVTGADPVTFSAVAVLALLTALFACYLPARRAANADPMESLRAE